MLDHTALVNKERESLEGTGYVVHTENQNLFRLRGTTATIAGKPDLIGEKTNEILISDAKTGHRSPSHRVQVQIYQYAVPKLDFTHFKRHKRGNLQYDGTEWRGVSVHRSWRSIVKNPPTPTTSGYAQR